jgi:hypothetical protein
MAGVTLRFRAPGAERFQLFRDVQIYASRIGNPFARVTKFSRKIVTSFRHNSDKTDA